LAYSEVPKTGMKVVSQMLLQLWSQSTRKTKALSEFIDAFDSLDVLLPSLTIS